ncbi:MAG: cbb3-type cytochrome oxidase assembly protein CcoS [Deltaproteobacteria bacterium]
MRTVFLLIFISTVLGAGAWLLFLWAVRSGQYDDTEGPKHRMLDDGPEDGRDGDKESPG